MNPDLDDEISCTDFDFKSNSLFSTSYLETDNLKEHSGRSAPKPQNDFYDFCTEAVDTEDSKDSDDTKEGLKLVDAKFEENLRYLSAQISESSPCIRFNRPKDFEVHAGSYTILKPFGKFHLVLGMQSNPR